MSIFQIQKSDHEIVKSEFSRFGLKENPFPDTGLHSKVLYTGHIKNEISEINLWLKEAYLEQSRPLVISGQSGVGKTHLLHVLKRGLLEMGCEVTLRSFEDENLSEFRFQDFLLRNLPFQNDKNEDPCTCLIRELVAKMKTMDETSILNTLGSNDIIVKPLLRVLRCDDCLPSFSRWLRGITSEQCSVLGVYSIENSLQSITAITSLLRLAKEASLYQSWFIMIDQFDLIFRETSLCRGKFLRDLRIFLSQTTKSSVITVLSGINSAISESSPALGNLLKQEVKIPTMDLQHSMPFVREYLKKIKNSDVDFHEFGLKSLLFLNTEKVIASLAIDSELSPRKVLSAWRECAFRIAASV